jgi:hypothetical protein
MIAIRTYILATLAIFTLLYFVQIAEAQRQSSAGVGSIFVGRHPGQKTKSSPSFFDEWRASVNAQVSDSRTRDSYIAPMVRETRECRFTPVARIQVPREQRYNYYDTRAGEITYLYTTGTCSESAGPYQVMYSLATSATGSPVIRFGDHPFVCISYTGRERRRPSKYCLGSVGCHEFPTFSQRMVPGARGTISDPYLACTAPQNTQAALTGMMYYHGQESRRLAYRPNPAEDNRRCVRECWNGDPQHDYNRCVRICGSQ